MVSMSGAMLIIIFLMWGGFGFPTPTFNTTSSVAVPANGQISYKNDVEPIFTAHCSACHMNGVASGGLSLSSYAGLVKGGNVVPGPVFKPGDHKASVIWQITQPGPTPPWPGGARMPLGGPYLTPAEIQTIATWIDQGAKNN
jgi:mono/diheme cytochrome c family protein